MFDFKYKKHNSIYNNLVKLSRNIYFYKDIKLDDKLENRVIIIFAHLVIILNCLKNHKNNRTLSQEIYDNIFLNIENNLREIGHGDVTVNKKMKDFNQIFHDLLVKFVNNKNHNKIEIDEMIKFLFLVKKSDEISTKLQNYFIKYYDFCFDIINKNMIKDLDKFEY
jgi:cytochrome b pre-mRNA-processing protein 3